MKKSFTLIIGFAVLAACSQTETTPETAETTTTDQEKNRVQVIPNQLLTMEVSGMSCEMACGGAIREGLMETGAVARVQYDFEMGRDVNVAKISFDNTLISPEKMVQIVSKLNNKQFTVGETTVSEIENPAQVNASTSSEGSSSDLSSPAVSMDEVELDVPNLFDLLRSLVK